MLEIGNNIPIEVICQDKDSWSEIAEIWKDQGIKDKTKWLPPYIKVLEEIMKDFEQKKKSEPGIPKFNVAFGLTTSTYKEMTDRLREVVGTSLLNFPNEKHMIEKVSCFDKTCLQQDIDAWTLILNICKKSDIPENTYSWIKRYLTLLRKVLKALPNTRSKRKAVNNKEDESIPAKQVRNYLIHQIPKTEQDTPRNALVREQSVPTHWRPWSTERRSFKLILEGPLDERTQSAILNLVADWPLSYNFKIVQRSRYTWILFNSAPERTDFLFRFKETSEHPIRIPPFRWPQLLIKNARQIIQEPWPDFLCRIMKLNGFRDQSQYKFLKWFNLSKKIQNKNDIGIVFQVSPALRSAIQEERQGSLSTGVSFVKVYDDLDIISCWKCHNFGHTGIACKQQPRCYRCCRPYHGKCSSENTHCPACDRSGHAGYSDECPRYRNQLINATADHDYDYTYLMLPPK